jgi:hypothetical protein
MKVYIWNEPYEVSYGSSWLVVVAKTEEQARKLAERAAIRKYGLILDSDGVLGDSIKLGVPRVENLPFAECYEWSE